MGMCWPHGLPRSSSFDLSIVRPLIYFLFESDSTIDSCSIIQILAESSHKMNSM